MISQTDALVGVATGHDGGLPARYTPAVSPDAYDLFLKDQAALGRASYTGNRHAASYFEQAILKQPDFARAYARLALVWSQLLFGGGPMAPDEVLQKADAAALTAVALDDTAVDAHRVLARNRRVRGRCGR